MCYYLFILQKEKINQHNFGKTLKKNNRIIV